MSNSSGGLWPPANWTDWPGTRIGGLVFDAIVLVLLLALPPCRHYFVVPKSDNCARTVQAICVGCVIGLFIHFIPCIWWTCDWGPSDGQAIRGGIWFLVWAIVSSWLLCCRSSPAGRESSGGFQSYDAGH
jgi:hypothetical protein